jgi:hypothetical protein
MGLLGLDDRAHPGRRPRPVNALVYPLYCSRWRGLTTCSSPDGYVSHETQWQGRTNGYDNQGDRWTTSRWQDRETTTVTLPPER